MILHHNTFIIYEQYMSTFRPIFFRVCASLNHQMMKKKKETLYGEKSPNRFICITCECVHFNV